MKPYLLALLSLTLTGCVEYSDPIAGPRTRDADRFAISFLDRMQARSFAENREFCGLFGRDADGYVIATAPVRGEVQTCQPPDMPSGFGAFASYHSHGGFDEKADSEVPTTGDLIADRSEGVIGYISTPGGRVWRTDNGVARQLCGRGCIAVDPAFRARVNGSVARRYTINQLRDRQLRRRGG